MTPHSNPYIREWLRTHGPATNAHYSKAHGLSGVAAMRIGQRMAGMWKEGTLSRSGAGGQPEPFVYAFAREAAPPQERAVQLVEARRRHAEAQRASGSSRLPRIPKPKPIKAEHVTVKRRRTVVTDIASATPSDLRHSPVDKAALPDTEAFIRANPDKVEYLAIDAPWTSPETLLASHRKAIQGA